MAAVLWRVPLPPEENGRHVAGGWVGSSCSAVTDVLGLVMMWALFLPLGVQCVGYIASGVPKHTLLSCSEHKDSSEKKHKDKEKTKHKDGSSEKHKDKHKDKDKEKRKEEKVGVSCGTDERMVLVYTAEW